MNPSGRYSVTKLWDPEQGAELTIDAALTKYIQACREYYNQWKQAETKLANALASNNNNRNEKKKKKKR